MKEIDDANKEIHAAGIGNPHQTTAAQGRRDRNIAERCRGQVAELDANGKSVFIGAAAKLRGCWNMQVKQIFHRVAKTGKSTCKATNTNS